MVTAQIVERKFKGGSIRQNHKTAWFNATDLNKIANEYRAQIGLKPKHIADYLKTDSTREFIKEILDREDISKAYETKKGKSGGTWVHPLILIDFAMWLSPEFKYEAMKWLEDRLIKNRDLSGDSYKKLASYLSKREDIVSIAKIGVIMPKIAKYIKDSLNVEDWNKTTEENLKKRDNIHNNFMMLLDGGVEINKALYIAVKNELEKKDER
jgi:hypothetical protein